jgi:hypothetical protein
MRPTRNLVKPNGIWFNRETGEAREKRFHHREHRGDLALIPHPSSAILTGRPGRKRDCRLKAGRLLARNAMFR